MPLCSGARLWPNFRGGGWGRRGLLYRANWSRSALRWAHGQRGRRRRPEALSRGSSQWNVPRWGGHAHRRGSQVQVNSAVLQRRVINASSNPVTLCCALGSSVTEAWRVSALHPGIPWRTCHRTIPASSSSRTLNALAATFWLRLQPRRRAPW